MLVQWDAGRGNHALDCHRMSRHWEVCCAITQRVVTAGRDHAYRRGMLVRQDGQRLCPGYSPQACQSASWHHYPPWTSANTVNGHGRHRRRVVSQTSPRALPPFRVRIGLILHCGGHMLVGNSTAVRSFYASISKAHWGIPRPHLLDFYTQRKRTSC